jgi:acyl-CoA-binding protein
MTDLEPRFRSAAERVQRLERRPNNRTLLDLYGLYKQATAGDASGSRPGMLDPAGRAKFDAWSARQGLSRTRAMEDYVSLVERLEAGEGGSG